jgi:pyruvate ferredoxin oxidoreductase beta subunit
MTSIRELPREEYLLPGTAACPGCGFTIGLRMALKALGPKVIMVVPAGCTSIIQSPYPYTSIGVPLLNIAFAAAASTASGITQALEYKGDKETTVLVWAGDGGTADIGIQALSGAAERGENFIYVCYDNEAYMNTGIQRSGATPFGAWTTTTWTGKKEFKKDIPMIMAAHRIPYVATASIAYPIDFYDKLKKAKTHKGLKYLHLHAPCPPGWKIPTDKTVEIAKLAVETGLWPLYEIENGEFRLTGPSKILIDKNRRKPVESYIKMQGRFSHMTDEDIKILQEWIDKQWEQYAEMLKQRK